MTHGCYLQEYMVGTTVEVTCAVSSVQCRSLPFQVNGDGRIQPEL